MIWASRHPDLANRGSHQSTFMPDLKSSQGELTLQHCQPLPEHAKLVMNWRNDPTTLEMSYHHEPKVWESFWPEFRDTYFDLPQLPPLFVCIGGTPFAFVRFQPCRAPSGFHRAVDISLNVDPAYRGRKLAPRVLELALTDPAERRDHDVVVAEVRARNVASHKAFLAAGFTRLEDALHTVEDTGEVCEIVRYIFDLSRLTRA